MKDKVTLDEFLNEPSSEAFLCTVEVIPNDTSKVKITPWINERVGCSCESAMNINRDLIENLVVTDLVHFCCGRKHKVVELYFKNDASMKMADVLAMSIKRQHQNFTEQPEKLGTPSAIYQSGAGIRSQFPFEGSSHFAQSFNPSHPTNCPPGWQMCGSVCYNPEQNCCCCGSMGCYVKSNIGHQSCFYVCQF